MVVRLPRRSSPELSIKSRPWRREGRSNKEIAADMHLGVSTVEAHLSSVYRKLGVKRAELGARLRDDAAGG